MTNVLKELTKEAVSLPYEEQKELFESLSISIRTIEAQSPTKHKRQKRKCARFWIHSEEAAIVGMD